MNTDGTRKKGNYILAFPRLLLGIKGANRCEQRKREGLTAGENKRTEFNAHLGASCACEGQGGGNRPKFERERKHHQEGNCWVLGIIMPDHRANGKRLTVQ